MKADPAARKQATRSGRARGCYIYIASGDLQRAGMDLRDPAPQYRVWAGRRGSLLVTLYRPLVVSAEVDRNGADEQAEQAKQ